MSLSLLSLLFVGAVDECRAQMKAVLAEARKLAGGSDGPLPFSRVVIGGFSLGSITSLDVALQLDAGETVAGTKR